MKIAITYQAARAGVAIMAPLAPSNVCIFIQRTSADLPTEVVYLNVRAECAAKLFQQ